VNYKFSILTAYIEL